MGSASGPGSPHRSVTLSISARVHQWRHTWVRDNQVRLRINRPGRYRDWLTVACVSSNAAFSLAAVLPGVSSNHLYQGSSVQPTVKYAWRVEGGEWQLGNFTAQHNVSGFVQLVILLEIDVVSLPDQSTTDITFFIG